MTKQYLYVGTTGLYFVDSHDDVHRYHKGIRQVGEINEMITENMEVQTKLLALKADHEQTLKTNGDMRKEISELKESYSQLEFQLRSRKHS